MNKRFSLEQLMQRTGGGFIILVLAAAQVTSLIAAIPGIISIQANAQLDAEQTRGFAIAIPVLIILCNLILLILGSWLTTKARKRLTAWAEGTLRPHREEEFAAWRELTRVTWQHGIASGIAGFLVVVLPIFFMIYIRSGAISSPFQPASLNSADPVYVLLGGLVSLFAVGILSILMIERLLLPARLVLLPTDFETQLAGRSGPLLIGKLILLTLGLIGIAILLIAPIGYQQTIRMLYADISSVDAFTDIQIQSIFFSVLALILGAVFAYYVSRSISDPV